MAENLGRCDKKQYEHCGLHPQYPDIGQRLPPFAPCVNWKPEPEITVENDAPELKPCPFCGSTATRGMFSVWCDSCGAETLSNSGATTEQIIAAWNSREDLAAPGAAQDGDLVSRSAVLDAIGHHLAYYKDHYMHCLTRCVPELIEKLPAANADVVRQARLATWEEAIAIAKGDRPTRGDLTVERQVIHALEAAALREKGWKVMEAAFCCRCKEDFEVAKEPTSWRMGEMRLLSKAPKRIRDQFREWIDHEEGGYLCGNCYFDLTD